jgi:hypothetical protein
MDFFERIDHWLWSWAQRRREQALQRHFRRMHPGTVTDIDKYLHRLQDRGMGL